MWPSVITHTQSEYAQSEGIYMWPSVIIHTIWICTKWGHLHVTISNNTHNLNMHKMRAFTCDHQYTSVITISNNTQSEYAQNEGIYMWPSVITHTIWICTQNLNMHNMRGIYMWPSVITHTIWICTKWGHLHVTISNNTHNLNMHKMRAFTCDHQ